MEALPRLVASSGFDKSTLSTFVTLRLNDLREKKNKESTEKPKTTAYRYVINETSIRGKGRNARGIVESNSTRRTRLCLSF